MKKLKVLFLICTIACIYPVSMYILNSSSNSVVIGNTVEGYLITNNANYTDPMTNMQWALYTVGADIAHSMGINGTNTTPPYNNPVVVAIIDTGIDYNHPDLNDNYLAGGYDFVNNDNDPMDDNGHGTHCAGIIAAEMNNSMGIVGVAPEAKVMAYKVLDSEGSGYIPDVTNAINHILTYHNPKTNLTHGVDIISMSLGASYIDPPDQAALQTAIDNAVAVGIIVVAAAGNEDGPVLYPARMSNVIAIAATNVEQDKASYSNHGSQVDYAAPGGDWHFFGFVFVGILSTWPNDGYAYAAGTSMATPMAAGIIALLLGNGTTPANVETELQSPSRIKDLGSVGWDSYFGYGLIRIVANNWDYDSWYHKHYDDEILQAFLIMFGEYLIPEPQINWVYWVIIGGVVVFFAIIAIYEISARK